LAAAETTLAEVFHAAGHATGCIGKWHLGFITGMRPLEQGFDSYYGVLHNLDKPETVFFEAAGGMPILRGDAVEKRPAVPAEMTGLYTAEALKFITTHRARPFFLYLSHAMPHLPYDASAQFKGKSARGLYGDVVEELDDSVGQVLDTIRTLGIADQTLVLFTSDNGPERNTGGSAAPLSGGKHTVYEGGLRVPCIAWWPGHVSAARTCDAFLSTLDLMPTFAHLIHAAPPASLDGFDQTAVLLDQPGAASPRSSLYSLYGYKDRRLESMREGRWKLHFMPKPALYDLQSDLTETQDISAQHTDCVEQLTRAAQSIRKETGITP
jgi:arylsulfatase A